MNKLLTVSSIVTYTCLVLLVAAFGLNAWGVVSGKFSYSIPVELLQIIQVILGASTAVWTASGIAAYKERKAEQEREEKEFEEERTLTIPPHGKVFVPRYKVSKAEESIEAFVITAPKFEEVTDEKREVQAHLDNLYRDKTPQLPASIHLSIPPLDKECNHE